MRTAVHIHFAARCNSGHVSLSLRGRDFQFSSAALCVSRSAAAMHDFALLSQSLLSLSCHIPNGYWHWNWAICIGTFMCGVFGERAFLLPPETSRPRVQHSDEEFLSRPPPPSPPHPRSKRDRSRKWCREGGSLTKYHFHQCRRREDGETHTR